MKDLISGSFRVFPRAVMEIAILNSLANPTFDNIYLAISILLNLVFNIATKTTSKYLFGSSYPELINRPDGHGFCGSYLPNYKFTDINNHRDHINLIGMPSGHSSIAWFLATFFLLKLWKENSIKNRNAKYFSSLVILVFAIGVSLSRTDMLENCHTYSQVVIGGILGVLFGLAVFHLKVKVKKSLLKLGNKEIFKTIKNHQLGLKIA